MSLLHLFPVGRLKQRVCFFLSILATLWDQFTLPEQSAKYISTKIIEGQKKMTSKKLVVATWHPHAIYSRAFTFSDIKAIMRWIELAFLARHPDAVWMFQSWKKPDTLAELFAWAEEKSQHHPVSAIWLGHCYERGLGVEQNYQAAYHVFSCVSHLHPFARYRVYDMLYVGRGVKQDRGVAKERVPHLLSEHNLWAYDAIVSRTHDDHKKYEILQEAVKHGEHPRWLQDLSKLYHVMHMYEQAVQLQVDLFMYDIDGRMETIYYLRKMFKFAPEQLRECNRFQFDTIAYISRFARGSLQRRFWLGVQCIYSSSDNKWKWKTEKLGSLVVQYLCKLGRCKLDALVQFALVAKRLFPHVPKDVLGIIFRMIMSGERMGVWDHLICKKRTFM